MKFTLVLKRQGLKILCLILSHSLFILNAYAVAQIDPQSIRLKEGDSVIVQGTEIRIFVKSVIDRTSSGCVGGPIGCRDQVTIEIHSGRDKVEAVLEIAKTPEQKKRKIDQTSIHAKTIQLIRLEKKEAEFLVQSSLKDERDH